MSKNEQRILKQSSFISADTIHPDLFNTINLVYNPGGLKHSQPVMELESVEYGACTFKLNELSIKFRVAKITPTKIGQFVTLWKRNGNGPIQPFDISDPIDFFIICTRKDDHFGQFVFPKSVLSEQDIISINGKGGKRGIRVYPSWDKTLSRQAQNTQKWQVKYFIDLSDNNKIKLARDQMHCLLA